MPRTFLALNVMRPTDVMRHNYTQILVAVLIDIFQRLVDEYDDRMGDVSFI